MLSWSVWIWTSLNIPYIDIHTNISRWTNKNTSVIFKSPSDWTTIPEVLQQNGPLEEEGTALHCVRLNVAEWLVSQCECRHRELVLAGLCVSVWWDAGLRSHSPLCRVRRPPDKTPRGSVPVGVSPLSCNTLSFSSLLTHRHTNKDSYMSDHRTELIFPALLSTPPDEDVRSITSDTTTQPPQHKLSEGDKSAAGTCVNVTRFCRISIKNPLILSSKVILAVISAV